MQIDVFPIIKNNWKLLEARTKEDGVHIVHVFYVPEKYEKQKFILEYFCYYYLEKTVSSSEIKRILEYKVMHKKFFRQENS